MVCICLCVNVSCYVFDKQAAICIITEIGDKIRDKVGESEVSPKEGKIEYIAMDAHVGGWKRKINTRREGRGGQERKQRDRN